MYLDLYTVLSEGSIFLRVRNAWHFFAIIPDVLFGLIMINASGNQTITRDPLITRQISFSELLQFLYSTFETLFGERIKWRRRIAHIPLCNYFGLSRILSTWRVALLRALTKHWFNSAKKTLPALQKDRSRLYWSRLFRFHLILILQPFRSSTRCAHFCTATSHNFYEFRHHLGYVFYLRFSLLLAV